MKSDFIKGQRILKMIDNMQRNFDQPTSSNSKNIEREKNDNDVYLYLQRYLEISVEDAKMIEVKTVKNMREEYQPEINELNDDRLKNIDVAIIPGTLWHKGSQPSESHAEKNLILIKQDYYNQKENPDEIAWILHELAHCQNFLDSASVEDYQKNMNKFAFEDIVSEYPYPNNLVEVDTFHKQFQYLKKQGKTRDDIVKLLKGYYAEEDFPFFQRVLDSVFAK